MAQRREFLASRRASAGGEEALDLARHLGSVFVQDEMPAVEPDKLCVGQVALERFSACRDEEGVLVAPDDQRLGMMLTESGVPAVVQRDIVAIIVQQIELISIRARPVEQRLVMRPVVWTDGAFVPGANDILILRGFGSE